MIESIAESICSWLAWISSLLNAPVLAASITRLFMEISRALISESAPSEVAMTLLARSMLSTACETPEISVRKRSETIRPAGSSAPRLIFSPVLSRCSLTLFSRRNGPLSSPTHH